MEGGFFKEKFKAFKSSVSSAVKSVKSSAIMATCQDDYNYSKSEIENKMLTIEQLQQTLISKNQSDARYPIGDAASDHKANDVYTAIETAYETYNFLNAFLQMAFTTNKEVVRIAAIKNCRDYIKHAAYAHLLFGKPRDYLRDWVMKKDEDKLKVEDALKSLERMKYTKMRDIFSVRPDKTSLMMNVISNTQPSEDPIVDRYKTICEKFSNVTLPTVIAILQSYAAPPQQQSTATQTSTTNVGTTSGATTTSSSSSQEVPQGPNVAAQGDGTTSHKPNVTAVVPGQNVLAANVQGDHDKREIVGTQGVNGSSGEGAQAVLTKVEQLMGPPSTAQGNAEPAAEANAQSASQAAEDNVQPTAKANAEPAAEGNSQPTSQAAEFTPTVGGDFKTFWDSTTEFTKDLVLLVYFRYLAHLKENIMTNPENKTMYDVITALNTDFAKEIPALPEKLDTLFVPVATPELITRMDNISYGWGQIDPSGKYLDSYLAYLEKNLSKEKLNEDDLHKFVLSEEQKPDNLFTREILRMILMYYLTEENKENKDIFSTPQSHSSFMGYMTYYSLSEGERTSKINECIEHIKQIPSSDIKSFMLEKIGAINTHIKEYQAHIHEVEPKVKDAINEILAKARDLEKTTPNNKELTRLIKILVILSKAESAYEYMKYIEEAAQALVSNIGEDKKEDAQRLLNFVKEKIGEQAAAKQAAAKQAAAASQTQQQS